MIAENFLFVMPAALAGRAVLAAVASWNFSLRRKELPDLADNFFFSVCSSFNQNNLFLNLPMFWFRMPEFPQSPVSSSTHVVRSNEQSY